MTIPLPPLRLRFQLPVLIASACLGHAAETTDTAEPSAWSRVTPGIHSSFGTTDIAYSEDTPPKGDLSEALELRAWKGERVNGKLLIWSNAKIDRLQLETRGLRRGGHAIDAQNISTSVVRYVLTDQFLNERGTPCGPRDNDRIPVHSAPDILDESHSLTIDANRTRPVWISIDVPPDIPSGLYSGTLDLISNSGRTRHGIRLEVLDHRLPPPAEWSFHLDLWQNPFAVARFHEVEPWSDEHMRLLRPYLTMLAKAGQKCVTTTLIDYPWGGEKPCYDDYRDMIRWTRKKDGSWVYDYSIFDRYVRLAMDCGITDRINGYTMVSISDQYSWHDEESEEITTRQLLPGTAEYEDHWRPFLLDFTKHLEKRGWLEKTTIALDERAEEEMAGMLAFLRKTAPGLKVSSAGFYHEGINSSIHEFSSNWRDQFRIPLEKIRERKTAGQVTTYYVACGIPKPNNFTFSPPAESCFIGWMASAMGFDGFLRWAYNSWPENPLEDSRYIKWPAGDTYLVYPGPLSSIRFERLREGIQDYEKIRILRKMLAEDGSPEAAVARGELDGFLAKIRPGILEQRSAAKITREGRRLVHRISEGIR